MQRAVRLLEAMKEHEVLPHVAMSLVRRALELRADEGEGRDLSTPSRWRSMSAGRSANRDRNCAMPEASW